jgi:hypothetical protein
MEALHVEEEALWSQTGMTGEKGITFDLTVGSRSKFHTSFRRSFSLEYLWNPNSLKRRPCGSKPE